MSLIFMLILFLMSSKTGDNQQFQEEISNSILTSDILSPHSIVFQVHTQPVEISGLGQLRGSTRRILEEDSKDWKDRVKEKGEAVFQEKKRAAIRAACYKDWFDQIDFTSF